MNIPLVSLVFFFFFNDTATTEIYTLSLHDALPIWPGHKPPEAAAWQCAENRPVDRKSTRLNSSHLGISYAVFCLKKKKTQNHTLKKETHKKNNNTTKNKKQKH